MAQKTQRIGPFSFVSIDGQPDIQKKRLMVDERPGVEGIAVWDQLAKGRPFSVGTLVDVADIEAGRDQFDSYREEIGKRKLGITKDDINYVGLGAMFVVLDVTIVSLVAAKTIVGGLNVNDGDSGALLRCRWDLVAVDV